MKEQSQKEINIDKIRSIMYTKEKMSKSELSRESNLSFPTITRIIEVLCASGEIVELGPGDSTGGRYANEYALNANFSYYLLIKIEGNRIEWSLKNIQFDEIEGNCILFENDMLEQLDLLVETMEKKYSNIKKIAIGIAAVVHQGKIEQAIREWDALKGIDIIAHFESFTKIPVAIRGDMHVVTMGQWYRNHKKLSSIASLYYGDNGFGSAMMINNQIWNGMNGFAGEISFLPFDEPLYDCFRNRFQDMDVIDIYRKVIQCYVVLINPSKIVLYSNKYIENKINEIRVECCKYLPYSVIPHIEISQHFQLDYQYGLFAIARDEE